MAIPNNEKISYGNLILGLLLALIVIFGLADLYAWSTLKNPASFLNFLFTLIFSVLIVASSSMVLERAYINGYRSDVMLSAILSLFAFVWAWCFYFSLVFEISVFSVFSRFWYYFGRFTDDLVVNGGIPYFSWSIEAVYFLGTPIIYHSRKNKSSPTHCANCDASTNQFSEQLLRIPERLTREALLEQIKQYGMKPFYACERADKNDDDFYEFVYCWCSKCNETVYLTVVHNTREQGKVMNKLYRRIVINYHLLEGEFDRTKLFDSTLPEDEPALNQIESSNNELTDPDSEENKREWKNEL